MQETWVWSLWQEDPLEKEMANPFSILAWRIPWMEEPGGTQSTFLQRDGHNRATSLSKKTKDLYIENYKALVNRISQSVQFSSVAQSCPTLCDPMNCTTPGLPVHHKLPEFTQTHVHRVGDAIQSSHSLSSPSPPALNLSHHQGLFKWISFSHQVAKVLEFQLQHQSFQWTLRTDL